EPPGDAGGLFACLLDRLGDRRQLRAAGGERREHGAEGAALLARGRDEQLEIGGLLLGELVLAGDVLEGVQHARLRQAGLKACARTVCVVARTFWSAPVALVGRTFSFRVGSQA